MKQRTMLGGKIHRAAVTDANVDYAGSIEIDKELMDAAGILPYEQVHVFDINNGNRFITYVIEGRRGSGVISVNGAAAKLVSIGDLIIIVNYIQVDNEDAKSIKPSVIVLDKDNKPTK